MVKNFLCPCRRCKRHRFDPGSRRSPGRKQGNSRQYSYLENAMDPGTWQTIAQRITKSWLALKWLSMHTHTVKTNWWVGENTSPKRKWDRIVILAKSITSNKVGRKVSSRKPRATFSDIFHPHIQNRPLFSDVLLWLIFLKCQWVKNVNDKNECKLSIDYMKLELILLNSDFSEWWFVDFKFRELKKVTEELFSLHYYWN